MRVCPVCSREYPAGQSHCPADGALLVALSTDARAKPEDLIGQVVDGRFRVERIVGKGGMGVVYAARHVVVGREVALKVIRSHVEGTEGVLQRFIREAQLANSIRSRHIVEMSDFGQLPNGSFYVVMELLEGEDLTRAMRSGRLSTADLLHVFIQTAEALQLAHDRGIVHRDLKPDNVFLVREQDDPLFVKLLDFGIAKVLHQNANGLTETGIILGTPYFMSPEQARGDEVDHRSDIYALGVMMYRAFTGKLPFTADTMMGVLTRHLTELPELPSHVTNVHPATEFVILRCLEKRPADRFSSMREVAASLRAILEGRVGHVTGQVRAMSDSGGHAIGDLRRSSASLPMGTGPHPLYPSTPSPQSVSYPELGTQRGVVTSGIRAPGGSSHGGAVVAVLGALVSIVAGAGVAYGLFGAGRGVDHGTLAASASAPVPVVTSAASSAASSAAPAEPPGPVAEPAGSVVPADAPADALAGGPADAGAPVVPPVHRPGPVRGPKPTALPAASASASAAPAEVAPTAPVPAGTVPPEIRNPFGKKR